MPDTLTNAQSAVNTLALRGCGLIVAATPAEVNAVETQAHDFTATHFAIVSNTAAAAEPSNVTAETSQSSGKITATIDQLALNLAAAVGSAGG